MQIDTDTLRVIRDALAAADEMNDKALPKFNWGASFLDAQAIQLLNETPSTVKRALATVDAMLT
ncbi:hypothetical protein [Burkholderia cenocepacia]|uniref:hypothetical protein n=1 Tax=Burkholderia cenocepacia TaxID=95486 RepID=UPI002ABE009F|nr:hypothetical protein [Burkholderia cenocepacia]